MSPKNTPLPDLTDLKPKDGVVRIMALGGLGEIGMNCMIVEYSGEMLLVDCGQMLPDEAHLGIDYIIPDVSYVRERKDRLAGIVLTHAHEDHVGAIPYILPQVGLKTPIYGSELTIALQKEKIREHGLKPNFQVVRPRETFRVGKHFEVEPISVTHSIVDAFALAIRTPVGIILHTGDYKIDPSPPDGVSFDFHAITRYAEEDPAEGILLLLGDSTNADRSGSCPSEADVVPALSQLIRSAAQQVVFACFSSSIHRIQTVMNIAAEQDKVVFPVGLNMDRNIRVASRIGILEVPCRLADIRELNSVPRHRRLILTTGSQGEPLSALSRMSTDSHKFASIEAGDTVILSARMIPGNEKAIYRMINHFSRRGAHIFYSNNIPFIHVSGHAYRDDMRHMINLANPRFIVPVHGEFRHLKLHQELAYGLGMEDDEVFLLEDGDCLELTPESANIIGKIPHGRIFVDGKGIGDVEEVVIRDRRYLSEDGVVLVICGIDRETGDIITGPDIVTRGVVLETASAELIEGCRQAVLEDYDTLSAEDREESSVVEATIKRTMRRYIKKELMRFPVILPVIMEI